MLLSRKKKGWNGGEKKYVQGGQQDPTRKGIKIHKGVCPSPSMASIVLIYELVLVV